MIKPKKGLTAARASPEFGSAGIPVVTIAPRKESAGALEVIIRVFTVVPGGVILHPVRLCVFLGLRSGQGKLSDSSACSRTFDFSLTHSTFFVYLLTLMHASSFSRSIILLRKELIVRQAFHEKFEGTYDQLHGRLWSMRDSVRYDKE